MGGNGCDGINLLPGAGSVGGDGVAGLLSAGFSAGWSDGVAFSGRGRGIGVAAAVGPAGGGWPLSGVGVTIDFSRGETAAPRPDVIASGRPGGAGPYSA